MARFLFLLHEVPGELDGMSPEDMQAVIEEYTRWAGQLGGRHLGGNKLADEPGRQLARDSSGVRVIDGPFSETKERIGGYFLVEASGYEQAVELARGCPHLRYGSRIEVRQIDELVEAEGRA